MSRAKRLSDLFGFVKEVDLYIASEETVINFAQTTAETRHKQARKSRDEKEALCL